MSILRPAPTLDDVARLAGVSTATVSRALNVPDKLSADTKDRVLDAVRTLGYAPNFAARVMASRKTNTIGAIIPTMENAIFAQGLQAFQEELRLNGYTLLVASSAYDPNMEEEQIRTLVARGADGLLLIGLDRSDAINVFLRDRNIPTLVAWTLDQTNSRPSIGFDNRAAMMALAQKVIGFGHRRLALISAIARTNDRARARWQGVLDAMEQAGLSAEDLTVVETPYGIDNGANAFDRLWTADRPPTAVMCGNDVLAIGAMRRARELGLEVPRDVSITGFDDIEIAQVAHPALTTVHVPHAEMGRRAAQALLAIMTKAADVPSIALSTDLKLRGSLGPNTR